MRFSYHNAMKSNDTSQSERLDPRFQKWENISRKIIEKSDVSDLLSKKIISIHVDGVDSYFVYKPSHESEKFFNLYINPEDLRAAGITTLANGQYEKGVERVIYALLAESRLFIDIGANVGFYSCFATAINPSIRVYSFEPNPNIQRKLHNNISFNRAHERITVLPFGLGQESAESELFIPPHSGSGAGSLRNLHPEEGSATRIPVSIRSLDELFPSLDCVDLLKIDIEGSELAAIRGGLDLIQRNRPVIVVELLRKWMQPFDSHPQDVLQTLVPLGYKSFSISDECVKPIEKIDEKTLETNFLFFPNERDQHVIKQIMNHGL